MGPDGSVASSNAFSDRVPPTFDGRPTLIGRLGAEAKQSAKTLTLQIISSDDGVMKILEHLDMSYAVDVTNRLDLNLADFLDYT
eukprot:IDg3966t1